MLKLLGYLILLTCGPVAVVAVGLAVAQLLWGQQTVNHNIEVFMTDLLKPLDDGLLR